MALNSNILSEAGSIIDSINGQKIRKVKRETGLLERENDPNKTILMEDDRQILLG